MDERGIAFEILNQIQQKKAYSHLALKKELEEGQKDQAFVRRLVYGVLEKRLYLDYVLDHYTKKPVEELGPSLGNLLRMGAYQILFMDGVPGYAAVNESVKLCRKKAKGREGFVNAVLRNLLRGGADIKLPSKEKRFLDWLSITESYPKWMVGYWAKAYGNQAAMDLARAGNQVPPLTIRVNLLKTEPEALAALLRKEGFRTAPGQNSLQALYVEGKEAGESSILSTRAYRRGLFQIQDESSMLAVECLDPRPGETVLDLCAAPGGKTVYIGERMKNQGQILAFDLYAHKLDLLRQRARAHGISCIAAGTADATVLNPSLYEKADKVLCDVPCSGLGVIRRKPEIKYEKNYEDILTLARVQRQILEQAADYVKPGGALLYSTCTVSPLENEEICEAFEKEHPDFEPVVRRLLTPCKEGTDGFFLCKFKKNA